MKRILSVLLLVLSLFFLASCDLFNKKDNTNKDDPIVDNGGNGNQEEDPKVELELTVEQMQALVEDVDFSKAADDIVEIKSDIEFRVEVLYINESLLKEVSGEASVNGGLEIYINLTSFEDSYVYAKANLAVVTEFDLEGLFDEEYDPEEMPDMEMNAIATLLSSTNASFLLEAWLIKGVLYVEASVEYQGETVTIKQFDELFTEEEFDFALAFLEGINEQINFDEIFEEFDEEIFDEIDEMVDFNAYQVGDSYVFEAKISAKLDELLQDLLGMFNPGFDDDMPNDIFSIVLLEDNDFENSASIQFSDKIEKIGINSTVDVKVRVEVEEDEESHELEVEVYLNAGLSINFQGQMPNNPPDESRFADFEEEIDLSELFQDLFPEKERIEDLN